MKRFGQKAGRNIAVLLGAAVLVLGGLTGCGSNGAGANVDAGNVDGGQGSVAGGQNEQAASQSGGNENSNENSGGELSGAIQMVGSTSMEKLANALGEAFMAKYNGVTVTEEFTGSSAGVEAVLGGSADVGNSSRNLKEEELSNGAVENVVAVDGIAVCVDTANALEGISRQQLIDIYTGSITNWSEVGGEDAPIIVVGREAGSGTRGAFEEILGIEDACAYANELDSTGAVMARVESTPGAIGYVSLDAVKDSVKVLTLDGVAAAADTIKAGDYFLARPFIMATKGAVTEQSELVQAWFEFVLGEEGQEIAAALGLVKVGE